MQEKNPEETPSLSIGLHVLSISVNLMRVTDPMPEKMEDAIIELTYSPREPSESSVRSFPLKDNFSLSMTEVEELVGLFSDIKSVNREIEDAIKKIGV